MKGKEVMALLERSSSSTEGGRSGDLGPLGPSSKTVEIWLFFRTSRRSWLQPFSMISRCSSLVMLLLPISKSCKVVGRLQYEGIDNLFVARFS